MVFENQKKKQKRGFPIEDFGNDGGGSPRRETTPVLTLTLPGRGLVWGFLKSVTPAIFKPGSMVFKNIWIPDQRFQKRRGKGGCYIRQKTLDIKREGILQQFCGWQEWWEKIC